MRVSPTRLIFLLLSLLVAGWLIGRFTAPTAADQDAVAASSPGEPEAAEKATIWTCSMHPQIQLSEPGNCPICFMELIPMDQEEDTGLGPRTLVMGPNAMAMAEIQTAPVIRREVAHELQLIGRVAFDETRLATITAWVPGRLDRLYVDYTGVSVRKGDHLVALYSPELYAAQQELRQAIETAARIANTSIKSLGMASDATVIAAREKLRLLGLAKDQIAEIEKSGTILEHLTIRAPIGGIVIHRQALEGMYVDEGTPIYTIADLTKLWIELDAYETDVPWLRYGQKVKFEVEAYPGESFAGRIAFIDPLLDDATRTIMVRINVDNEDLRLKPEMFVHATVRAVLTPSGKAVDPDLAGKWMCPMHPEVTADGPEPCSECGMDLLPATELGFVAHSDEELPLVIPASAPLITGRRAVVYVRVPDTEKPTFEGRVITLGPRAGDWYVVRDGLKKGERVVVNGAFKLDSELQLKGRPSMMKPDEEEAAMQALLDWVSYEAPPAFRLQLGELTDKTFGVQQALASDDLAAAKAAAAEVLDALSKVEMAQLTGKAHAAWMTNMAEIHTAVVGLAESADLDSARQAFHRLSTALIGSLRTFGFLGAFDKVQVTHCSMAFDGDGADWLQKPGQTANPYLGTSMPGCGDTVEILEAASDEFTEAAEIPAAFRAQLGAVADAYLEIQTALTGDHIENASEAAGNLVDVLRELQPEALSESLEEAWNRQRELLLTASKALFRSEEADPARQAFLELSQALIGTLEEFGYQRESGVLQVFHCPMAFDGAGADWLQAGDQTANPFLGAAMPRCGDAVRPLPQER